MIEKLMDSASFQLATPGGLATFKEKLAQLLHTTCHYKEEQIFW
jgi:hypothetical protein